MMRAIEEMKFMKNKKAWIRIVEALIAIMIIMAGALYVVSKKPVKDISDEVYEKQRQILEVIANNESMRKQLIEDGNTELASEYVLKNLPSIWDFRLNICGVDEICTHQDTPNDKDIYTSEIIITSTLTSYPEEQTKKLIFFAWKR